ncbi:SWI/SNF and RSC complex subunit Arp42 [Schizosaccharomyces japonicus yFS275]|uniref:SWI/SNF and RSC complex subunit Arp42 n=1 Tax=Schizosaccharomyces japonicus (strain yFS275 / FY16936) TaxID=402676 RepID=B6JX91_SCHJY|nr:SWI/SNF and RSC complex subunit Arp42 [Schizosaccharomyces japonicus yFS275]EEB05992.1 SWI/SNF and RSC complex subunit Arp42 [Schizosaccharomyces japonicus yFS275]
MSQTSSNIDVPALVIDQGSCWARFGYAGDDAPTVVLPSKYGVKKNKTTGESSFVIDQLELHAPIPHMEILSGLSDGVVQDWNSTLNIWKRGLNDKLGVDASEYAMMVTEPSWNPRNVRQQTMETAFEQFKVPAFFLSKQAVCAAFANNRATALVVNLGSKYVSVTPVVDGLAVRKGLMKQNLAGDFLNANIERMLENLHIPIHPHYRVARKATNVDGNEGMASVMYNPVEGLTASYEELEKNRVIEEWKESVLQMLESPFNERSASVRTPKPFEFPDGISWKFGGERFRIAEILFNPSLAFGETPATSVPQGAMGLPQLVHQSILTCDNDIRSTLLNNIIITGGTSLIPGLAERLQTELQRMAPGSRVTVLANGSATERKNATWLGGSILASLNTFQHLWITKQEYEEIGVDRALFIEKRCK